MQNGKIVKVSDNTMKLFYIDRYGLCYKNPGADNGFKIILKNVHAGFDVLEYKGQLVIICEDINGSIILLRENSQSFLKSTLLNNKNKNSYDKHFKLLASGDELFAFYIIKYEGELLLTVHKLFDTDAAPEVIDKAVGESFYVFNSYNGPAILYNSSNGILVRQKKNNVWADSGEISGAELICACRSGKEICCAVVRDGRREALVLDEDYSVKETKALDFLNDSSDFVLCVKDGEFFIVYKQFGNIYEMNFKKNTPTVIVGSSNMSLYDFAGGGKEYNSDRCFANLNGRRPKILFCRSGSIKKDIFPEELERNNEKWHCKIAELQENIEMLMKQEQILKNRVANIEEFINKLYEFNSKK